MITTRIPILAAGLAFVPIMLGCPSRNVSSVRPDPTPASASSAPRPGPVASVTVIAVPSMAPAPIVSAESSASTPPPSGTCPPEMAALPGGTLKPADGSAPVTIAPFCMDKFEVTVARYRKCVDAGKCVEPAAYNTENGYIFSNWKHPPPSRDEYPVNAIPDRAAAIAMCAFEQKTIPSDPQWEWAARGGPNRWQWPWGNTRPTEDQANLAGTKYCTSTWHTTMCGGSLPGYGAGHFDGTAPVGSLPTGANPWGVQDLIGNLYEVTSGNYELGGGLAPLTRVRGGSFGSATWTEPEVISKMPMLQVYPGEGDIAAGIRCVRASISVE